MQSEHQHIDDFFRKKEEQYMPGNSLQQMHWQQMTGLLAEPGLPAPTTKTKVFTSRRIIKFLGGFSVVTIVTVILITTAGQKKTITKKHIVATSSDSPVSSSAASKTTMQKKAAATIQSTGVKPASTDKPVATVKPVSTLAAKQSAIHTGKIDPGQQVQPPQVRKKVNSDNQVRQVMAMSWDRSTDPARATTGMAANEPVKKTDGAALLASFYKELQQPEQRFAIEGSRDTIIAGGQGTRLHIPANAFVTATGKPVIGSIRIILKEYYRYEDIIAAKLSTTSNGQQLVTGGMVHISAEANNETVQIQPGRQIKLTMPAEQYDDRMQLFGGNNGPQPDLRVENSYRKSSDYSIEIMPSTSRKGVVIRDTLPTRYEAVRANENNVTGVMNITSAVVNWVPLGQKMPGFTRPDIKVKDMRDKGDVEYGKKTKVTYRIDASAGLDKKAVKKEMEARYGYFYDEIKIKSGKKTWRSTPFGRLHTWHTVGDSIDLPFDEAVRFKLISRQDSISYIAKVEKDSASFIASRGKGTPYVFVISNLGWFNCDRFQNDPSPKIEITLRLEDGFDNTNFSSRLLFTRYRSVMPGNISKNNIRFFNIPENEPVQFISIGVKDGKVLTCVQQVTASQREINDLHFEELTPEQFKARVSKIDSDPIK
jgi:hypothetical protein